MNLFTATNSAGQVLEYFKVGNKYYRAVKGEVYFESDLTDLTPVKVVPKDAVVIEGVGIDELTSIVLYSQCPANMETDRYSEICREINLLSISPSQLSTPAKEIDNTNPETTQLFTTTLAKEDESREAIKKLQGDFATHNHQPPNYPTCKTTPSATTEDGGHPKDCYRCKDEVDRKWREDHKPTPTVTIELTEQEARKITVTAETDGVDMGFGRGFAPLDTIYSLKNVPKHVADELRTQLTPTPEPMKQTKEIGTRIRAQISEGRTDSYSLPFIHIGNNVWVQENCLAERWFRFSDLINPVVIREGVEK